MPLAWTCVNTYDASSTVIGYSCVASSTAIIGASTSTPLQVQSDITYHDWSFVAMTMVFLLSFLFLGLIFSPFKR